jgi:hypothetical protein
MAGNKIAYQIDVDSKGAQKSLGQLESEFEKLNKEIREVPKNSKEFSKLQKELAQTGREIKNVELSFESLDNEQVASELGSVAGAVGDVSAAFILMGDDSETLQEVAKNIEMAMGLSMGLKGAIEGVSSARKLLNNSTILSTTLEKLNSAGTFIAATAQKAYALAVGTSTGMMKLFRLALISTGIGAIVVGIVLLIANFDKVTAAVKQAVKWFMSLGEGVKLAISIIFPFIGLIRLVNAALVSMGVVQDQTTKKTISAAEKRAAAIKKEAEETIKQNKLQLKSIQKYTKDVVESIDWEIRQREAAGKDIGALEKTKLLILKKSSEDQIKLLESTINEEIKLRGDGSMRWKYSSEIIAEGQLAAQKKNLKKLNQDIEISNIEYLTAASDKALADAKIIEKANADKRKQEKDASDKRSEARKAENEKKVSEQEALNEKLAQLELERIATEQTLLQDRLTREEEQFQLLRDITQTEQENEMDDLIEGYESKFELANGNAELELALQNQLNTDLAILNERYREKEIAADDNKIKLERLNNKQRVEMGSEALGALSTLVSAFSTDNEQQAKRQFKVNKALNLAQATTNTALAITGALAEPSLVPGARFIKAGIAGATGAANIIKIASTQFGSTGGAPSSSVSLGNTASATGGANVPSVTNTTTTLDGATQVYVTEQDISSTQNKVQVAENIATV